MKSKIAIFHDFFGSIGGGEKLVLELAKALNADIITSNVDENNLKKLNIKGIKIISLGQSIKIPVIKHIHSSIKFSKANFSNYDFYIMSGNWSIFAAKKHQPNLLYCHTPVRMFYDSYNYFKKLAPAWARPIFTTWVSIHKYFLEKQLKHTNKIVANSKNVQQRIKKYYKKDSVIVNPPIKQYKFKKNEDFWLSVNRIYPHKRIELQIEGFKNLSKEKLVIVGGIAKGDRSESYLNKIKKNLPKNVTLLGEVSEKKLEELYGNCKAFITTSKDEDFGMSVLEAMSAGKPVIATAEGGHIETIVDGKTGKLLTSLNPKDWTGEIQKISSNPKKYKLACQNQAKKFTIRKFIQGIKKQITLSDK